jgi:hypothetical protein
LSGPLAVWHYEVMAGKLAAVVHGRSRRLIVSVPPRHLKSHLASVAFPAWCLGHDPSAQILCVTPGFLPPDLSGGSLPPGATRGATVLVEIVEHEIGQEGRERHKPARVLARCRLIDDQPDFYFWQPSRAVIR